MSQTRTNFTAIRFKVLLGRLACFFFLLGLSRFFVKVVFHG